jgi:hypothetical protein
MQIVRRETISVPAGSFDTFLIEGNGWNTTINQKLEARLWLVPGVNFAIRREFVVRNQRGSISSNRKARTRRPAPAGGRAAARACWHCVGRSPSCEHAPGSILRSLPPLPRMLRCAALLAPHARSLLANVPVPTPHSAFAASAERLRPCRAGAARRRATGYTGGDRPRPRRAAVRARSHAAARRRPVTGRARRVAADPDHRPHHAAPTTCGSACATASRCPTSTARWWPIARPGT